MAKKKDELESEVGEVPQEASSARRFVVVAPFELERNYKKMQYQKGDSFDVPEGWERDLGFEEFAKIDRKSNPELNRIVFSVPAPVLDEKGKLKYMDSKRVILPLKEA